MTDRAWNDSDPLRERLLEYLVEDLRREAGQHQQQHRSGWKRLLPEIFGQRSDRSNGQPSLTA